jgi:hypothetical protein
MPSASDAGWSADTIAGQDEPDGVERLYGRAGTVIAGRICIRLISAWLNPPPPARKPKKLQQDSDFV